MANSRRVMGAPQRDMRGAPGPQGGTAESACWEGKGWPGRGCVLRLRGSVGAWQVGKAGNQVEGSVPRPRSPTLSPSNGPSPALLHVTIQGGLPDPGILHSTRGSRARVRHRGDPRSDCLFSIKAKPPQGPGPDPWGLGGGWLGEGEQAADSLCTAAAQPLSRELLSGLFETSRPVLVQEDKPLSVPSPNTASARNTFVPQPWQLQSPAFSSLGAWLFSSLSGQLSLQHALPQGTPGATAAYLRLHSWNRCSQPQ